MLGVVAANDVDAVLPPYALAAVAVQLDGRPNLHASFAADRRRCRLDGVGTTSWPGRSAEDAPVPCDGPRCAACASAPARVGSLVRCEVRQGARRRGLGRAGDGRGRSCADCAAGAGAGARVRGGRQEGRDAPDGDGGGGTGGGGRGGCEARPGDREHGVWTSRFTYGMCASEKRCRVGDWPASEGRVARLCRRVSFSPAVRACRCEQESRAEFQLARIFTEARLSLAPSPSPAS